MPGAEHKAHAARGDEARAVITGLGLATSLGLSAEATWAAIRAGRVGLGASSEMESALPAGAMSGQALELPGEYAAELPREARYLRWVIEQALKQAGTRFAAGSELKSGATHASRRCAVLLGTTLHGIRAGGRFLRRDDTRELQTFLSNAVTRLATRGLEIGGMSATTCSACSSSLGAIALGVTLLETGAADVVVAGGYDAVSEYSWAGFNSLRLVSPTGVKPFAKNRDGMVPSEGYGVVVLERSADAARRGAKVVAVVDGWGESADAHHLTQPDPKGTGAARAIRAALGRAGVDPRAAEGSISMIAAHATATPDNDGAEHAAFADVFGEALPRTPVIGFKSYLGHTLGGAGAVELILSACALSSGLIPACATVEPHDVEWNDLTVAPAGGIERRVLRTLNTSLGFGGANTCVVLRQAGEAAHEPRAARHASEEGAGGLRQAAPPAGREAWITGVGLILPGITGVAALRVALEAASTAQRMDTDPGVRDGALIVPRTLGLEIKDDQLAQVLNVRRVRRLSACVKLMLASVSMALRDAGLEGNAELLAGASAILASTHGSSGFCSEYYSQIVREGALAANPVLFAEGVPNAAAAHVSTNFGIKGACQTIIGARNSGLDALGLASLRVKSGASDLIVVGAAEETHARVDGAYQDFLRAAGDPNAGAFFSTPGGVAFIVESSESATARGAKCLARLAAFDSTGVGAASGAASVRAAREMVSALPGTSAVLGSGNGTYLDRLERLAAGGDGPRQPLAGRVGDLFSAASFAAIALELVDGATDRVHALSMDYTGGASAITLDRIARAHPR